MDNEGQREPDLLFRYRDARIIVLSDNTVTYEVTEEGKLKTHWCSYYKKDRMSLEKAIKTDCYVNLLVGRYIVPTNTKEEQKKYGTKNRADDILEQIWRMHSGK